MSTPTTPAADDEREPSTGEEWIIAHIRKLENSVDDILFALKAGGYAHQHLFKGTIPPGPMTCACGAVLSNDGVTGVQP